MQTVTSNQGKRKTNVTSKQVIKTQRNKTLDKTTADQHRPRSQHKQDHSPQNPQRVNANKIKQKRTE